MYEEKQAYVCMKKQAYKCMKKKLIQMYDKNTYKHAYEKNPHANV